VAKSFARIFYRNAINVGLPVIELKEVDEINQGDELEIDLENGVLKNLTTGKEYRFNPIPKFLLGILKEDGIVNYLKKHGTFPKV
jgi:3-isopropylmalate/(R)-2-methylmalate dehydratase small subunit